MKKPGNISTILAILQKGLTHFIFWVAVWFFFYYFFSFNSNVKVYVTWFSSLLLPLTMLTTYFIVYFLIPRFLLSKQYFKFALYTFYTLVASSNLISLTLYACLIFLLHFDITLIPPMSKNYLFILVLVYLVVGIVSFINLLKHNFKTSSKNKELENKILATQLQLKDQELQYLKMQIHPHFLFNTLNTIYGLALKQSKQTPDVILKLSNLLDYILYQVSKPTVSLNEELLHIKEYIDLERIRFQETLRISLSIEAVDENIQIAPMLLIPLMENAFKHGKIIDNYLRINIRAEVSDNQLIFVIKNTTSPHNSKSKNGGIGLENVKKRLDLHYKNNHQLTFEQTDNWYTASLTIFKLNKKNNGEIN
ncbi:MAG: sensor histidine kinase [Prolixibacteraceae bacterium]